MHHALCTMHISQRSFRQLLAYSYIIPYPDSSNNFLYKAWCLVRFVISYQNSLGWSCMSATFVPFSWLNYLCTFWSICTHPSESSAYLLVYQHTSIWIHCVHFNPSAHIHLKYLRTFWSISTYPFAHMPLLVLRMGGLVWPCLPSGDLPLRTQTITHTIV